MIIVRTKAIAIHCQERHTQSMKQSLSILGIFALALTLSACGSAAEPGQPMATEQAAGPVVDPAADPASEPAAALTHGDYWFFTELGAIGKFTFPGEPYAPAEALREVAGAEPVSYVKVTVDNRENTEHTNIYEINAFDAAGKKYVFSGLSETLDVWGEDVSIDDTTTYNRFVDLNNKHIEVASAGEVRDFIMVSETADLPAEFTRIAILTSGVDPEIDATPIAELVDGVDLSFEAPK